MDTQRTLSDPALAEEFRSAHIVWTAAVAAFHDRFQEIIIAGQWQNLDSLAQDLTIKFDHFMHCSKALVAGDSS